MVKSTLTRESGATIDKGVSLKVSMEKVSLDADGKIVYGDVHNETWTSEITQYEVEHTSHMI